MRATEAARADGLPRPQDVASPTLRLSDVLGGWCLLVVADVLLRLCGFDRFYRVLRRWPIIGAVSPERRHAVSRATCAGVDRARAYYVRRAWCLQSAAAAVCLLRLRGIESELVIGVRKLPFYAHAWVLVDGQVVLNDRPGLDALFREIARC